MDVAQDPRALGRLATSIAGVLMGKHKPIYHPSTDCGDYVVVSNCKYIYATGNKMENKKYYKHSGKPGQLQVQTMEDVLERKGGGEILRRAVLGMLPKNRLRKFRIERLKTFEGSNNPYAQNVFASYDMAPEIKKVREQKQAQATDK